MKNIIEKPISKIKNVIRILITFIVLIVIGFFILTTISFYMGLVILLAGMFSPYILYKYYQITSNDRKNKNVS